MRAALECHIEKLAQPEFVAISLMTGGEVVRAGGAVGQEASQPATPSHRCCSPTPVTNRNL